MQKIEEMTLEEKVDELLVHQRRLQKLAIFRGILSFVTFFVLVILPIWGFYYLVDQLKNTAGFNFTEIGETLKRAENLLGPSNPSE